MTLVLSKVRAELVALEQKYGISTFEFMDIWDLQDKDCLEDIEEEDVRGWEGYYRLLVDLENGNKDTA